MQTLSAINCATGWLWRETLPSTHSIKRFVFTEAGHQTKKKKNIAKLSRAPYTEILLKTKNCLPLTILIWSNKTLIWLAVLITSSWLSSLWYIFVTAWKELFAWNIVLYFIVYTLRSRVDEWHIIFHTVALLSLAMFYSLPLFCLARNCLSCRTNLWTTSKHTFLILILFFDVDVDHCLGLILIK